MPLGRITDSLVQQSYITTLSVLSQTRTQDERNGAGLALGRITDTPVQQSYITTLSVLSQARTQDERNEAGLPLGRITDTLMQQSYTTTLSVLSQARTRGRREDAKGCEEGESEVTVVAPQTLNRVVELPLLSDSCGSR